MAPLQCENENRAAEASGNTHRCEEACSSNTHTHTRQQCRSDPASPPSRGRLPHAPQGTNSREQTAVAAADGEARARINRQPATLHRFVHPPRNFHSAHYAVKRPGEVEEKGNAAGRSVPGGERSLPWQPSGEWRQRTAATGTTGTRIQPAGRQRWT